MHVRWRSLAALTSAGVIAAILVPPSPALAKSDYGVTVAGGPLKTGGTVKVTVSLEDDGGIGADTKMCLFQIRGGRAPQAHTEFGYNEYPLPAGSRYVKVADCRRPSPDRPDEDPSSYDSGATTYTLKIKSGGWLAFAAFRQDNGVRDPNLGPILSNVVQVSGSGSATSAEASLVSVEPPHEPASRPTPSGESSASTASPDDTPLRSASVGSPDWTEDDPSSDEAAQEAAAREGRPRLRWLAAAASGGFLLGALVAGVALSMRSRARARRSEGDRSAAPSAPESGNTGPS